MCVCVYTPQQFRWFTSTCSGYEVCEVAHAKRVDGPCRVCFNYHHEVPCLSGSDVYSIIKIAEENNDDVVILTTSKFRTLSLFVGVGDLDGAIFLHIVCVMCKC